MSRLFVFAIGGTGSRVVKSLSFIAAAGVEFKSDKIIPILIDTDAQNGDTDRTKKILTTYEKIRKSGNKNGTENLFKPNLVKLSSESKDKAGQIENDYLLKFGHSNGTFAEEINYNNLRPALQDPTKALLNSLYSTSTDNFAELNLKLTVGYKGNPNIGSVMFNEFKEKDAWKFFETTIAPNDKVVIVASIFGGTGAAGLPSLVKTIRSSENPDVKNTQLGIIVALPYFTVSNDEKSAIKTEMFKTKAVSALSYYINNLKEVNATYYVADNRPTNHANHEGGREQTNPAHSAELFAAYAISHFDNDTRNGYFEFGVKQTSQGGLQFNDFESNVIDELIKPLIRLKIASIGFQYLIELPSATTAKKNMGMTGNTASNLGSNSHLADLMEFFKHTDGWFNEMSDIESLRLFKPNLDKQLNDLIIGKEKKKQILGGGVETLKFLNVAAQNKSQNAENALNILDNAANEIIKELLEK